MIFNPTRGFSANNVNFDNLSFTNVLFIVMCLLEININTTEHNYSFI